MPKVITFDLDKPGIVESGGLLLALLTHPKEMLSDAVERGSREEKIASRIYDSICISAYMAKAEIDLVWANSIQLKPCWLGIPVDWRSLKALSERWRRGLVAGRMALIFIDHALIGQVPEALRGSTRLTLDTVCEFLGAETRLGDGHNFENRIWRLYRPVVHLLAAAHRLIEAVEQHRTAPVTMGHMVTDPVFIRAVIRKAEAYEETLLQNPYTRLTDETLLRVRLAA